MNHLTLQLRSKSLLIIANLLSAGAMASPQAGKHFDHVIFVLFENTSYSAAMKEPFFKHLAKQGANLSNFLALTHPSQGNYVALTSGDLNGVTGDENYDLDVKSVVDLLESKGLTWKVYAEDYPGKCFTGSAHKEYARKHNPFISYLNIQKSPARCAHIVNADQFDRDAAKGSLPNYAFYVPNQESDGHNTGVAFADKWYSKKFSRYIASPSFMKKTLLISTFDEGLGEAKNHIYTSLVGPMVKAGVYTSEYTTPSLLRLVEENWKLGNLGKQDATANPIQGIWK